MGGHTDALFEQPGDVKSFLDGGQMKPILTFLKERPSAFADTPSLADIGADFEPLLRFRGFWTRPDVPQERQDYLEQVCERAWKSSSFQEFNKSKYMHLIDSYRGIAASRQMIQNAIDSYRRRLSGARPDRVRAPGRSSRARMELLVWLGLAALAFALTFEFSGEPGTYAWGAASWPRGVILLFSRCSRCCTTRAGAPAGSRCAGEAPGRARPAARRRAASCRWPMLA